jgi:uncharacterized protein YjbI with pentapeptide repeats
MNALFFSLLAGSLTQAAILAQLDYYDDTGNDRLEDELWTKNFLEVNVTEGNYVIDYFNACSSGSICSCDAIPFSQVPGHGRGENFAHRSLSEVDWHDRNLSNIQLHYSILDNADLTYTNLGFARLMYASLANADLSNSSLVGANLQSANLRRANLEGIKLFDGDITIARPVSFARTWKSVTIDFSPLPSQTFIDRVNVEICGQGETFISFLMLEGNGANIIGADFTDARNLSPENLQYICWWGGEWTRQTLKDQCNEYTARTRNWLADVIQDTFLSTPRLIKVESEVDADRLRPILEIEFDHAVLLRPDALVLRPLATDVPNVVTELLDTENLDQQFYRFQPIGALRAHINYELVLLPGKAVDYQGSLLSEEVIVDTLQVP